VEISQLEEFAGEGNFTCPVI